MEVDVWYKEGGDLGGKSLCSKLLLVWLDLFDGAGYGGKRLEVSIWRRDHVRRDRRRVQTQVVLWNDEANRETKIEEAQVGREALKDYICEKEVEIRLTWGTWRCINSFALDFEVKAITGNVKRALQRFGLVEFMLLLSNLWNIGSDSSAGKVLK
ncbi:hypothetical protein SUGI_0556510 [Cryptomeria japonica]|nr:hypothetical protein SUGI_0556510 [Cryptomeria japonica]